METTKKLNKWYRVAFFSVIILNLALIAWGLYENYANMAQWKYAMPVISTIGIFWFAKKLYSKPKKVKDIFNGIMPLICISAILAVLATGVAASTGDDLATFVAVGELLWGCLCFFTLQDEKKPHMLRASIILIALMCYAWLSSIFPVLDAMVPVMQILAILSVIYFFFGLGYLALGREE